MLPELNIPELQISLPIISFYTFRQWKAMLLMFNIDDAPVSEELHQLRADMLHFSAAYLVTGGLSVTAIFARTACKPPVKRWKCSRGSEALYGRSAKKVIIANTSRTLTPDGFATTDENGVVSGRGWVWLAYTFQICFDFLRLPHDAGLRSWHLLMAIRVSLSF